MTGQFVQSVTLYGALRLLVPCFIRSNRKMKAEITGQFSSVQNFNATRQLSHIEVAPDKSGLVLLDYWVGLKRCLVIIHN